MEKFNSTSIFTGYIKQLLSSFNLPKIRVYTKENADYKNKWLVKPINNKQYGTGN